MMKSKRNSEKLGFGKWLLRTVSEYLYPAKCISCGSGKVAGKDTLDMIMKLDPDGERRGCFCADCMGEFLDSVREVCADCGQSACVCECAPEALKNEGVDRVYSSFVYDKRQRGAPASRLIYSIKGTENRDSINFAAYLLAERLQKATYNDISEYIITFAPRRRRAVRENGADHMKLISCLTAEILGVEWREMFYNVSFAEQKKKNTAERMISAEKSLKMKKNAEKDTVGRKFIILDDIVTSGATLSACVSLLYKAGAENVIAATLAKAKKYKTENGVAK